MSKQVKKVLDDANLGSEPIGETSGGSITTPGETTVDGGIDPIAPDLSSGN